MPELKNPQHEKLSVLLAKGGKNQGESYLEAGFKAKNLVSAAVACSRLLMRDVKIWDRVGELKRQWALEAGATTTGVIRVLRAVSEYDIADIMDWKWVGTGRRKKLVAEVHDLRDISPDARMAIKSFKMTQHGPEITFTSRVEAQRLVGSHLGMFQGESANPVPPNVTNNNIVFVDAPKETMEEWIARIERQQGVKQINMKPAAATNGAGKG